MIDPQFENSVKDLSRSVANLTIELVREYGRLRAVDVLAEFGAQTIQDLPLSKLAAYHAHVARLLDNRAPSNEEWAQLQRERPILYRRVAEVIRNTRVPR